MEITAAQVKALRDATGAGIMDSRNALREAGGDLERATQLLRERGKAGDSGTADASQEGETPAEAAEVAADPTNETRSPRV